MARIALTRDGVCMADDVYAPNAGSIDVADDARLDGIARAVMGSNYLASIAGGSATWFATVEDSAVVFGWVRGSRFLHLLGPASPPASAITDLHIRYAAQDAPAAVCQRLGNSQP